MTAEHRRLPTIKGLSIATELLETGYPRDAGPHTCNSKCCFRGAYVDTAERDRVLAHAELILPHLDATQSRNPDEWFEHELHADPDYPSGQCVGTAVINDKCALLDARGYCSLQVAANANGMHKWALKPLYCSLFPIEVQAGVVKFDARNNGTYACCSTRADFEVPVLEACKDELVRLLGEDGFAELRDAYRR